MAPSETDPVARARPYLVEACPVCGRRPNQRMRETLAALSSPEPGRCAECEFHRGDPRGVPPHDHEGELAAPATPRPAARGRNIDRYAFAPDRPAGHPEETCLDCGRANPVWHAPNDLWNAVMGTPDNPRAEGTIVCPSCFAQRAGDRVSIWTFTPDRPAGSPPPFDVESLARAWGNVMDGRRLGGQRIDATTTTPADWQAIAREYAALGEKPGKADG